MLTQNRRLAAILGTIVLLLSVPLIAMQFTTDVKWNGVDFAVAGFLLLATGLTCELVLRRVKKTSHRILVCGAILLALFLVWAELAVGIFGTPLAGH